jgi:hypothetical protein
LEGTNILEFENELRGTEAKFPEPFSPFASIRVHEFPQFVEIETTKESAYKSGFE